MIETYPQMETLIQKVILHQKIKDASVSIPLKLSFNDILTADTILYITGVNKYLFAHKVILLESPYFKSRFTETNLDFISVSPTVPHLFPFCIEYLYQSSKNPMVGKSTTFWKMVPTLISKELIEVFINASYLKMLPLVSRCTQMYIFCNDDLGFLNIGKQPLRANILT